MSRVRYGPRTAEELRRAREAKASVPDVWSVGITAVWETDPEVVATVLPRPLDPPAQPLVRINISQVDISGYSLGAGTFAVAARHAGVDGWYPLLMPMTTERALTGGREVFGEPKKLGEVSVKRNDDEVVGRFGRQGITLVEVRGRVGDALEPPPLTTKIDFYFKFLPAPDGDGFDNDPKLVYCHREERTRSLHHVDGEVILGESPFDPVADLPVRRLREIRLGERQSDQRGEIVTTVPAEWLLPYAHQRYDDPMQAFDAPPVAAGAAATE